MSDDINTDMPPYIIVNEKLHRSGIKTLLKSDITLRFVPAIVYGISSEIAYSDASLADGFIYYFAKAGLPLYYDADENYFDIKIDGQVIKLSFSDIYKFIFHSLLVILKQTDQELIKQQQDGNKDDIAELTRKDLNGIAININHENIMRTIESMKMLCI